MTRLTIICTSFIIVSLMSAGQSYANIEPKTVWKSDGVAVSAISNITQVNPRIVADGYGGAIICWQDYRYTDIDIYAQRLDADGKVHSGWTNTTYSPWKDYGVQITGVEDGDQVNPNLISDGSGGAIIVWSDKTKGVRGQRVGANGTLLWAGGSTSGVDIGVSGDFDIISDGAGGVFVVGQVVHTYHSDIRLERVDAKGKRPVGWPIKGVDVCTAWEDQSNPTLARDGSNGVIVAWEDERKGAIGIYAQRVDGKGNIVWSSTPNGIAISTGDYQIPQIISDGAGGAIITWENYPWLGWGDIYARRVDGKGNFPTGWSKSANGVPICTALSVERNPMLVRNGSGHVIITWVDYRGADSDIYAQRVDGKGDPFSGWKKTPGTEGQKVCGASGNQDYPQLIRCCSGGAIIIWEDKRNGHFDVYAGRIQGDGSIHPKWPPNGVAICSAKKDQTIEPGGYALRGSMITTDGCGGAIICWTDKRTDNWGDIFAQRLSYVKSSDLWITPHDGYWKTPDIWVKPNLVTQGKKVTLLAKVHNAGPYNATGVTVKFRVAYLQAGKPFANVGTKLVDVPAGGVATASIPWTPTQSGHTCVEVEISHANDPDLSNNKTQENLGIQMATSAGASPSPDFKLGNPFDPSEYPEAYEFELEPDTSDLPEGWTVELNPSGPFSLPHGETLLGRLQVHVPSGAMPGEAGIVRILDRALGYSLIVGGMTFQVVVEDDIYEENDTLETAWYPGYSWEGEWLSDFDDPGIQFDEDWYQIEVSPGCERVLVDCLFTHAEGDIDIAIMDPLGKWIAASTSVTDNEYIDVPDPAEGTYYILVYYGNGGNRYDLWWDDVELPTIFHTPQWLSNSCVEGSDAPSQTVDIWGKEVPLSFSISDDAEWLSCSPNRGILTREPVTIVVDYATSGLAAGSYSATITISAPEATNTPQTVGVDLTIGGSL